MSSNLTLTWRRHTSTWRLSMRGRVRSDMQTAIAEYQKTLQLNPRDDDARFSLAKVLTNLGKFNQAIPYLRGYIQHRPQDAQGYRLLGTAYADSGQLAQASEVLGRAEKLDPRTMTFAMTSVWCWRSWEEPTRPSNSLRPPSE